MPGLRRTRAGGKVALHHLGPVHSGPGRNGAHGLHKVPCALLCLNNPRILHQAIVSCSIYVHLLFQSEEKKKETTMCVAEGWVWSSLFYTTEVTRAALEKSPFRPEETMTLVVPPGTSEVLVWKMSQNLLRTWEVTTKVRCAEPSHP